MTTRHNESILVIGLGLIGGSLAAAARRGGFGRCWLGWDQNPNAMAIALDRGLIDEAVSDLEAAAERADLIIVAVPTLAVEAVFASLRNAVTDKVITDVASVKRRVVEGAINVFGAVPRTLVPGHPIAGKEASGVAAADADLFRAHRVILTPQVDTLPAAKTLVEELWRACGAELVTMTVEEHDRILAYTSHLPHLLAYALVGALAEKDTSEQIFQFAAGGLRDFTRIASSDPIMWRDIMLANQVEILASLDAFSESLALLRAMIEASDSQRIQASFTAARDARSRLLGWLVSRHDD